MSDWATELKRLGFDPRLTPARQDLAAKSLEGRVVAARYAQGTDKRVIVPQTGLWRAPRTDAGLENELLMGERFTVYEEREGWAWGQTLHDGYVGYLAADALGPDNGPAATHKVVTPRTLVFPVPDWKVTPLMALPREARVTVARDSGNGFSRLVSGEFVFEGHLAPLEARAKSAADVALEFLGTPYLWGGRTSLGLDCSGLVQIAFAAIGVALPRDTDLQAAVPAMGLRVEELRRDDLVFWDGHVGIMIDTARIVHANAYHGKVEAESLADAIARITPVAGAVTAFRRLVT